MYVSGTTELALMQGICLDENGDLYYDKGRVPYLGYKQGVYVVEKDNTLYVEINAVNVANDFYI